jgi:hypothetical protein
MYSVQSADEFRKELDTRAVSRGCTRLLGSSYGSLVWQGYTFGGKQLEFVRDEYQLTLRVSLNGPQSALTAAIMHAIEPGRSREQHERTLREDVQLRWIPEKRLWILESGQGKLLGLGSIEAFDNETLAQCCVNWLCSDSVPGERQ